MTRRLRRAVGLDMTNGRSLGMPAGDAPRGERTFLITYAAVEAAKWLPRKNSRRLFLEHAEGRRGKRATMTQDGNNAADEEKLVGLVRLLCKPALRRIQTPPCGPCSNCCKLTPLLMTMVAAAGFLGAGEAGAGAETGAAGAAGSPAPVSRRSSTWPRRRTWPGFSTASAFASCWPLINVPLVELRSA